MFLLSDKRLPAQPRVAVIRTLAALLDRYFDALPENRIEATTKAGMKMHERHFRRILGANFPIQTIDFHSAAVLTHEKKRVRGKPRMPRVRRPPHRHRMGVMLPSWITANATTKG
jgi:hypothetical protein